MLEPIEETRVETTWLDFPLGEPEATDDALEGPDNGAEFDLKTDADEMNDTVDGGLEDTTALREAATLEGCEAIEEPALLGEDFGPDVIAGEDTGPVYGTVEGLELADGIEDARPELEAIDEPFDDAGVEANELDATEESATEGLELAEGIELGETDDTFDDAGMDAKDLEATEEGPTEGLELADAGEDERIELPENDENFDNVDTEANELATTEEGGAESLELTEGIDDAGIELGATEAFEDGRLGAKELGPRVI